MDGRLPWRPIDELPVAPEFSRVFVIFDADSPEAKLLRWEQEHQQWGDDLEMIQDHVVRRGFTHFLEITPP